VVFEDGRARAGRPRDGKIQLDIGFRFYFAYHLSSDPARKAACGESMYETQDVVVAVVNTPTG